MQTSNSKITLTQVEKAIYIVFIATFGLIWLNQESLSRFWQQTYHSQSPWANIDNPIWKSGEKITTAIIAAKIAFATAIVESDLIDKHDVQQQQKMVNVETNINVEKAEESERINKNQADNIDAEKKLDSTSEKMSQRTNAEKKEEIAQLPILHYLNVINEGMAFEPAKEAPVPFKKGTIPSIENGLAKIHFSNRIVPGEKILLKEGNKVFYAGDSMMQGIAPHIMRKLRNDYGIQGIDLSKQSTGLAYPRSFNWPKTIKNTLNQHPEIKLMMVFMGPNDPWDMPGEKGKYHKFMTNDWAEAYRKRIRGILNDARQANVQVIWVGAPNMRREKLSQGVNYINKLYQLEVESAEQLYISVNELFDYNGDTYSDYKTIDDRQIKVRSGDGTHFTVRGQKIIAEHLLTFIDIEVAEEDISEDDIAKEQKNNEVN